MMRITAVVVACLLASCVSSPAPTTRQSSADPTGTPPAELPANPAGASGNAAMPGSAAALPADTDLPDDVLVVVGRTCPMYYLRGDQLIRSPRPGAPTSTDLVVYADGRVMVLAAHLWPAMRGPDFKAHEWTVATGQLTLLRQQLERMDTTQLPRWQNATPPGTSIADGPETAIVYRAGDRTVETRAYALEPPPAPANLGRLIATLGDVAEDAVAHGTPIEQLEQVPQVAGGDNCGG